MKTLLALLLLIPSLSWGNDDLSGKNLICGLDGNKSIIVLQFNKNIARVFSSLNFNSDFWSIHDSSYKYETSLTEINTFYDKFRIIIINRQNLGVDTTYVMDYEKDYRTFTDGYCKIAELERTVNAIESHKNDWKEYKKRETQSLKEQQKI